MKKILPIIVLLALVLGAAWWFTDTDTATAPDGETNATAPTDDPLDLVNAFYNDWLTARQSTTTDPYAAGLAADARVSAAAQEYITAAQGAEQDPVLCQTALPERTVSRLISDSDFRAEAQVLARGLETTSPVTAIVELVAVEGAWQIGSIRCQNAESGPEPGEFSFEKSGYLLKNVPAPLNSEYWHLVFTEDEVPGHTAPLFFSAESVCVQPDGTESTCAPDSFSEPSRAQVQGAMTEAGVDVARVTFQ